MTGIAWTIYFGAMAAIARRAWMDWQDPAEDREVVAVTAAAFGILFACIGVVLAVS